jgi:hypothetical protein
LANAAEGAINAVGRTVSSAIQGATLGNVFGIRNQVLGAIANPQGLINAAVGAAIQGNELETFGNESSITNLADNPLGIPNPPNSTISKEDNAFDPVAAVGVGLNSTNAFGPSGPPNNSTISGGDENIFN